MSELSVPNFYGVPHRILVPVLLVVFFIAGALSLRHDPATSDEIAHLPAGYTYLDRWDFRLDAEHPPLSKLWAALPLWLDRRVEADYSSPSWTGESILPGATLRSKADPRKFGFEFLNGRPGDPRREDPAQFLIPARLAMLIWGVLLGWIVFVWAREFWGSNGALLALFLYCLSPTMLAHSRLVTPDMSAALGFTTTLWCFWRFMQRPGWLRGALVGLALAAALLIKFSLLMLIPMLALIGAVWALWPGLAPWERRGRRRLVVYVLIGALLIGYLGIWTGYGFRYLATPDPEYQLDWEAVGLKQDRVAGAFYKVLDWQVLPQAYLYGLVRLFAREQPREDPPGEERWVNGAWYSSAAAFLLKTPPALLLLLILVTAAGLLRTRGRSFDGWYLALPVLLYLAVSMISAPDASHRHLVPVYPLLFIAAGGLMFLLDASRWRSLTLAVLLGGYAVSFAVATPRYLSYSSFLARGLAGDGAPEITLGSRPEVGRPVSPFLDA